MALACARLRRCSPRARAPTAGTCSATDSRGRRPSTAFLRGRESNWQRARRRAMPHHLRGSPGRHTPASRTRPRRAQLLRQRSGARKRCALQHADRSAARPRPQTADRTARSWCQPRLLSATSWPT
ncbi:hypothetical protein T492DRAFT_1063506 [Pavlovales sp. CCMP2436]|nr:hypothetical protein T492DRAFT_1063506 [Pavlovales sp. CCMP2436]